MFLFAQVLSSVPPADEIMSRETARNILIIALIALIVLVPLLFGAFYVFLAWRTGTAGILDETEVAVFNRLGRWQRKLARGWHCRAPFINRRVIVDMRERSYNLPPQNEMLDGVKINFDGTAYWVVSDPYTAVVKYGDYQTAAQQMIEKNVAQFIRELGPDDFIHNATDLIDRLVEHVNAALEDSGFELLRFGFQNRGVPDVIINTLAGIYTAGARSQASLARLKLLDENEWPEYMATARRQLGSEATDEEVRARANHLFQMATLYDGPGAGMQPGFNIGDST